jgi:hypothetical protein
MAKKAVPLCDCGYDVIARNESSEIDPVTIRNGSPLDVTARHGSAGQDVSGQGILAAGTSFVNRYGKYNTDDMHHDYSGTMGGSQLSSANRDVAIMGLDCYRINSNQGSTAEYGLYVRTKKRSLAEIIALALEIVEDEEHYRHSV